MKEYPELFKGIGKSKNTEVKLHIDETVTTVAQPARRIPFHMRQKVASELDNLDRQRIIEKVEGPTPWVSPLVVIPKKNGDVRLLTSNHLKRIVLGVLHHAQTGLFQTQ